MKTFRLSYTGPAPQVRRQLVALLQRFPTARFVEKSDGEFEVTADAAVEADLRALADWRVGAVPQPA